jgi:hypothetical protein
MGQDDDADCIEHVWVLRGATLGMDGATCDYICGRCGIPMVTPPQTDATA